MNNKVTGIISGSLIVLGMHLLAYSQSEFDSAHVLLQKLQDDRAAVRTSGETKRLGEEERSAAAELEQLLNAATLKFLDTDADPSPEKLRVKFRAALQIGPEQPEPGTNA